MYKKDRFRQMGLADFDQPIGLKMNPDKPLRMALGSLIIQKQYDFSDRELVDQITENPYYQYFIGLPRFQQDPPFVPSLLVEFRKRLTDDILGGINEMIIAYNHPDDHVPPGRTGTEGEIDDSSHDTSGTLILDATCARNRLPTHKTSTC